MVIDEKILYKEFSYKLIGICMEVHKVLGKGMNEVVYKDAIEYELRLAKIAYTREKSFKIMYKGISLSRTYVPDFLIDNTIIVEAKAIECLTNSHVKQTLNYLSITELKLGLLVNFGEDSLKYRRVVL